MPRNMEAICFRPFRENSAFYSSVCGWRIKKWQASSTAYYVELELTVTQFSVNTF